jgi:(p)ppGpp synthase/HD superfamily hydrolase
MNIYAYDYDKITKALDFAEEHLSGLTRKFSDKPVIPHSRFVVEGLLGYSDNNTVVAGALHDVLEDTKFDIEMISYNIFNQFGDKVHSIVLEVTDPEGLSSKEAARHQAEHINEFSCEAKNLKFADKTANIEEIVRDYITMYPDISKSYIKFSKFYLEKSLYIINSITDYSVIHPVLVHRFNRAVEILEDILNNRKDK